MKKLITWAMAAIAVTGLAVVTAQAEDELEPGTALIAGVGLTDGNSDTRAVNVGIDHVVGTAEDKSRYSAGADWNYGETDSETTVQNASGHLKHEYQFTDAAYAYMLGTIFHDDIADLDYRLTLGPGVGSVLWSDDAAELGGEIGAVWIHEESRASTVSDEGAAITEDLDLDDAALRIGQYYNRDLSENAKIWQTLEYLPVFDDFGDYLLTVEIGIEAAINSSMGLRVVAIDRYDSGADDRGADENDISVLAGLSYKL